MPARASQGKSNGVTNDTALLQQHHQPIREGHIMMYDFEKDGNVGLWFDKFINPMQFKSYEDHSQIMLGRSENPGDTDMMSVMSDMGFIRVREGSEKVRIQLASPSRNRPKVRKILGVLWDNFPDMRDKVVVIYGLDEGFYSRKGTEFSISGLRYDTLADALGTH